LKDEDKPMDIERAKAVVNVAQTVINSAKVEVDFLAAIDSSESSEFFEMQKLEERRSLRDGGSPELRPRRLSA